MDNIIGNIDWLKKIYGDITVLKKNKNDNVPSISVIIPIYNVEKYVKECIESILNQTLENIEIVCINDGSTDKSLAETLEVVKNDDRVTVVSKNNTGLSDTRNLGIDIARGKYLCFCDSDDFLSKEALLECYKKAVQNNSDIILYSAEPFSEEPKCLDMLERYRAYYNRSHDYLGEYTGIDLFSALQSNKEYLVSSCMYIVKKNHIEKYHHRFISNTVHEDNAFTFEVLISADKASFINKKFYHRRLRSNSIMTNGISLTNVYGYLKCYLHMLEFIEKFPCAKLYESRIALQIMNTLNAARNLYRKLTNESRNNTNIKDVIFKIYFNTLIVEWYKLSLYKEINETQNIKKEERRLGFKERNQECDFVNVNNNVKVSIVIPIYNVESYLRDCLDSVIQQTLRQIEIICVNDASTDNSFNIVEEYAAKDPRIVVINQKVNGGLSVSRNVGANFAKGEYLYFLDSDDMISLNAMQELYDKAKHENLDVLCFEGDTFFENQKLEQGYSFSKKWCVRSKEYSGVKTGIQLMTEMYAKSDYKALVWILFIKRDFYVHEKLNFIPSLLFEDNPFTFECMVKAKRASHIWKKYYIRRVREESITTTNKCNIKYPYGFFYSGLCIMSIAENLEATPQESFVVGKEIERMFVQAQGQLNKIDEIEIQKYKDFNPYEKVLFEQFVLKPYNEKILNNKLQTQMKNKDNLLNSKNAEIERLRAKIIDETKEKDIASKNVKKLSETIVSKDNELNIAKQIVDKLTNEKEIVLRENGNLSKNLKNKEKELKKYKTELYNVKTGMSFRIGRVITYVPRKIMGRK